MINVIEVKNLKKNYNGLQAVKDVSFTVEQGEVFGILGPNGAGKTTTLEILEGIKQKTAGEARVLGFDLEKNIWEVKRLIGVQLQTSGYFDFLTLRELIRLFSSLYSKRTDELKLLESVGLVDKANDVYQNLSGGQKQRFTIATSLVSDPKLIFLDEPTTGLDPKARRELWQLIRDINDRGTTIILTTHYMEEAEYLCDRVAIMDRGEILTINEPRTLIDKLRQTTQISFFAKQEVDEKIWASIPAVEKVYSSHPKVILEINSLESVSRVVEILSENHIQFSGFTVKTATLEDVYLDLTGREFPL
ncbi:MAG: ABC transporter ATP-binding protein [Candidatus Doudnabacteria bacterium]|nr:ABC transporter ATP-binding protein [Candidatus Doudnabacteria bacterium]